MSLCPTCGKEVDALRARIVGVRDGKVVPFCSLECRDNPAAVKPVSAKPVEAKAEPKVEAKPEPAKPPRPPTPPAGVPRTTPASGVPVKASQRDSGRVKAPAPPLDSAPVIEIVREASSGAVRPKTELGLGVVPAKGESKPEPKPETKDAKPEPAQTEKAAKSTAEAEKQPAKAKDDKKSEKKDDKKPETKDDRKSEAKDDKKSDKKSEKKDDKKPEAKDDKKSDTKDDQKSEKKAEKKDDKPVEIAAKTSEKRTDATGARTSEGKASAAVSGEKTNDDELSDKPKKKAKNDRDRRDSMNAKAAWDWLDDEPAENVRAGTSTPGEGGSMRKVVIALVVLAVLAAGGILVYKFVIKKGSKASASTGAVQQPTPPPKEVVPPPPKQEPTTPAVDVRADALAKATEVLRGHIANGPPRIQRMAAAALGRTGDAKAIEVLAKALTDETAELPRLELAYQLARAGDKRGLDALANAVHSERRDVVLEAGRHLVKLHDERGPPALAYYLELPQHRMGVAEVLGTVGDAKAIELLTKIRGDEKAGADDKTRATIALGRAGKTEVAADLKALLPDAHWNAFAAAALATLHDEAARPVLAKQLDVASLRVDAARALRRLGGDVDAYLPPLVAALGGTKDTEQIQIAEAVVLLAGQASWSERA